MWEQFPYLTYYDSNIGMYLSIRYQIRNINIT